MERILLCRISKSEMDNEELKNFKTVDEYLKYKWSQQERAIKDKFGIDEFDHKYYDKGSAYRQEEFRKRVEFHKLLEKLFEYSSTSIKDIYWHNIKTKDMELYVYDYNRTSRILEYNLMFTILADLYNVKIMSYNQPYIQNKEDEDVREKGLRYMLSAMTAMSSEEYADQTSKNTKKATLKNGYTTLSSDNKVWGKGFRDVNKNKLSAEKTIELKEYIVKQIIKYESKHKKGYYDNIIKDVLIRNNVKLSKQTITRLKRLI